MSKPIHSHEGKKYLRQIHSAEDTGQSVHVDVYSVLIAFDVQCPALQHLIKKALCCGIRNKGSKMDDLLGMEAALSRATELQKIREKQEVKPEKKDVVISGAIASGAVFIPYHDPYTGARLPPIIPTSGGITVYGNVTIDPTHIDKPQQESQR